MLPFTCKWWLIRSNGRIGARGLFLKAYIDSYCLPCPTTFIKTSDGTGVRLRIFPYENLVRCAASDSFADFSEQNTMVKPAVTNFFCEGIIQLPVLPS